MMVTTMISEVLIGMQKDCVILPVAFPTTLLLDAFRIGVDRARFGKISRKMIIGSRSSVCKTGVVSVIMLLGASH